MPGQKNSGNKGKKRESGVAIRHRNFIASLFDELKTGDVQDVYIGRVIKKLGNGRVEVFFVKKEKEQTFDHEGNDVEKETSVPYQKQAIIKGSFRGRGKHSVWIETGSIVVVGDTGVGILEIVGKIEKDQLDNIEVDPRVLEEREVDSKVNEAIEFTYDISEADISNI